MERLFSLAGLRSAGFKLQLQPRAPVVRVTSTL
jgi:hypothetical protein